MRLTGEQPEQKNTINKKNQKERCSIVGLCLLSVGGTALISITQAMLLNSMIKITGSSQQIV